MKPEVADLLNHLFGMVNEATLNQVPHKEIRFSMRSGLRKRRQFRTRLQQLSSSFAQVPNMQLTLSFTEDKGLLSSTFHVTFRGTVKMINAVSNAVRDALG